MRVSRRQKPGCDHRHAARLRVNFVALATGAAVLLALLNFLPALSLGPSADGMKETIRVV
jgi:K+-transporting ATPase A subunit